MTVPPPPKDKGGGWIWGEEYKGVGGGVYLPGDSFTKDNFGRGNLCYVEKIASLVSLHRHC